MKLLGCDQRLANGCEFLTLRDTCGGPVASEQDAAFAIAIAVGIAAMERGR